MNPEAIINEALVRHKELLREAEQYRLARQLAANEPGLFYLIGQFVARAGKRLKTEFRTRLNTPVFGKR